MSTPLSRAQSLASAHPEWPGALVAALLPSDAPPAATECASEVVPGLLLAPRSVGADAPRLRALGVHTLVNVVSADEAPPLDDEGLAASGVEACCLLNMDEAWRDGYDRRIRSAAEALAEARAEGRVGLVHGAAGISRSAAVVLCYLMLHHRPEGGAGSGAGAGGGAAAGAGVSAGAGAGAGMPLAEALLLLRAARPSVAPRAAYLRWLVVLDAERHGRASLPPAMLAIAEALESSSAASSPAEVPVAAVVAEGGSAVVAAEAAGEGVSNCL